MTSAARPTFLPAVGGHSLRDTLAGPQTYRSSKALNAHLKLKLRHTVYRNGKVTGKPELKELNSETALKDTLEEPLKDPLEEPQNHYLQLDKDDTASESSEQEDSDSSDDDDDALELQRELEKIKQERQLERMQHEQQLLAEQQTQLEQRAMTGNPLLTPSTADFTVKRRWDDDVIFKNQSRAPEQPKKRFINDMLRSDFHRKFMNKYVK
jgi:protein CWC15